MSRVYTQIRGDANAEAGNNSGSAWQMFSRDLVSARRVPVRIRYIAASLCVIALAAWFGPVFIGLIRGQVSECPRCAAKRIRPALPRTLEKMLPSFIRTYRCRSCRTRFYARRWAVNRTDGRIETSS
jgi:hypothetical protein